MLRLERKFFEKDVLQVAPMLIGKTLVRKFDNNKIQKYTITETEAYRGEEDLACHASRGKTRRNEIMYARGGLIYVYLIYGMHWMMNFVTGLENHPQAVLIRGLAEVSGPGRITRELGIGKNFYGLDVTTSDKLWLEEGNSIPFITTTRVGIEYAGEWKNKPWRYLALL